MEVLVTGASGFIGFHLSKKLITLGYKVTGLDNINDYYSESLKYDRLEQLGVKKEEAEKWNKVCVSSQFDNFKFIRLNLEDRIGLPALFEQYKFDFVINLAAQAGVRYSLENPLAYVDSNIVGFVNILECCRHNKIKHLVYASSSSVYGENDKIPFSEDDRVDFPVSLYAATKKANELMAHTYSHLYKLPTSGLRFFTVYGPWGRPDMAPMLFADAMTNDKEIKVFNNGDMSRDFTYIDDIVNGIVITLENPNKEISRYQLFNIGNGSPVSLLKFIECMESSLGIHAKKNFMDMQPGDVPRTWADTNKLNTLGYQSTTSIKEGVDSFVDWFKEYFNN
jgi:UDP-glucuronate 4-epimerase